MCKKRILCAVCGEAPQFEKMMGGGAFPMSGNGSVYWGLVCDCPHKQNIEFLRSKSYAQSEWESENYKLKIEMDN